MSKFFISAAHKSSGKTTISIGLCAELNARGFRVQPFKKGPDYIDPLWLGQASSSACFNLDFYTTPEADILDFFHRQSALADICLVEGNKGLFDGMDVNGADSNAAMAKLLGLPVILVINTNGMTRGVAPLLLGYQQFDTDVKIAGVILNSVGGSRHESKLVNVLETYTDIPVIGSVWKNPELSIDERHLGLIPSNEKTDSQDMIEIIRHAVGSQVDIDKLLDLGGGAGTDARQDRASIREQTSPAVSIGIFQDDAFGFYYPDDLQKFEDAGAKLVRINALTDPVLPEIDGLFIGGGFPEMHMEKLAANHSLLKSVSDFIEAGGPAYAECGGLMYLARSLTWKGKHSTMAGIIPGDVIMHEKPQGRGYVQLRETANMIWPGAGNNDAQEPVCAHEFHYSSLENLDEEAVFAYEVLRGTGINGQNDGFIYKNLLANYAHMRNVGHNDWVERFLCFIRDCGNQSDKR